MRVYACERRFFAVTLHRNLAHRPSAKRGCRWHLQARHKSIVGNSCCSDCQNTGDHHLVAYSGCNSLARQQRIRHPCVGRSSAHISMGLFDYGRIIVELFLWIFNFHQIICLDYFFFVSLHLHNSLKAALHFDIVGSIRYCIWFGSDSQARKSLPMTIGNHTMNRKRRRYARMGVSVCAYFIVWGNCGRDAWALGIWTAGALSLCPSINIIID